MYEEASSSRAKHVCSAEEDVFRAKVRCAVNRDGHTSRNGMNTNETEADERRDATTSSFF